MTITWNPILDWDDDAWRRNAACRASEPGLFFPAGSTGVADEQISAAKAVCRRCPVRESCLLFAFETNQRDGVWGGTDEDERRKLRRSWLAARRRLSASAMG